MKTLLLAEPNPLVRQLLQVVFGDEYRLIEAADGESALGLVQIEKPDLILTEVLLPTLSGIDLCRLIKTDPRHGATPVMFLTVAADPTRRALGLEAGADGYVSKPFSPELLIRDVKVLLGEGTRSTRRVG